MLLLVIPAKAGIQGFVCYPGRRPGIQEAYEAILRLYLSKQKNGTIYTGITSDLLKRVWEHKSKVVEGFTKEYDVNRLVYFEYHDDPESAILREKQIKKWKRQWKLELIEKENSAWNDLYEDLMKL